MPTLTLDRTTHKTPTRLFAGKSLVERSCGHKAFRKNMKSFGHRASAQDPGAFKKPPTHKTSHKTSPQNPAQDFTTRPAQEPCTHKLSLCPQDFCLINIVVKIPSPIVHEPIGILVSKPSTY